jgi:TP901 family phage tail tape measure protein
LATNIINLEARLKFSAGNLKSEVTKAKGDLNALRKALNDTMKSIGTSKAADQSKNIQNVRAQINQLLKEIDRLKKAGTKNLSETTPLRQANVMGGINNVSAGLRKGLDFSGEAKASAAATRQANLELERLFYQMWNGKKVIADFSQHAISLRYALYDVAAVSERVGQAFMQMTNMAVNAGIQQEKSFTQVEKTLEGMSNDQVARLKQDLIELSQTIPVAFQDVTQIAMLGSQLNVAQDELVTFTDTVAKFSALSGMTSEESAMGFGKIANVLGLVEADGKLSGESMRFLGSAIVAVGYNAAATESQIVSTTKQIGAVATAAGLAATDVIALSSAFASLGVAPEEARGVTVQLFNEINRAANSFNQQVGSGSERLRVFAEVAGMTQEEFSKAWKDKSSESYFRTIGQGADATEVSMNGATFAFEEFVAGLGKGYDVADVLKKIGLDGVRTSKGITALSKGFEGLSQQIEIARKAGLEGEFLNVAFGKVADDIASKLTMLENAWQSLLAAGTDSSPFKNILGGILDALNALISGFQKITSNPVGSFVATLVISFTALVGIIGMLGSALLIGAGSMLAMRTALANAAQAGIPFSAGMMRAMAAMLGLNKAQVESIILMQQQKAAMIAAAAGTDVATAATGRLAIAMKVLKYAMISTVVGLLLVVLGSLAAGFAESSDAATEAATGGLNDFQKSAIDASKAVSQLKSELEELFDAVAGQIRGTRALDNALYGMGKAAQGVAGDFVNNTQALRDYEATITSVISSATQRYGTNTAELKAYFIAYKDFLIANGLATTAALAELDQVINSITVAATPGLKFDFSQIIAGLNDTGSAARGAAEDVKTLLEVVQEALKTLNQIADVNSSLRALGGSLEGLGKSFSLMNEDGSKAFESLNSAIESIVTSANENPQKAANELGALRRALWQVGVTSRTAYVAIDKAISATGKRAKVSAKDISKYFNQLATGLTEATKDQSRTIEDWADDIAKVISDALDIRFRGTSAQDAITSSWRKLSDAAADAAESVRDAKNSLDELNANRDILKYQLGIALKYGDTLRANKIQAELNKIDLDAAKAAKDLADAQQRKSTILTGNTDAAIQNRDTMRDLVQKYQAYLVTVAKTTTDQGKLATEANKVRADFLAQGTALGFSRNELLEYADAISIDFTKAVEEIPTNISLKLEGDSAAVAALKKFAASANVILNSIKTNITPTITPVQGAAPKTGAKATEIFKGLTPKSPASPVNPLVPKSPLVPPSNPGSGFTLLPGAVINRSIWRDNPATAALDPDLVGISDSTIAASRNGKSSPTSQAIATLRERSRILQNKVVSFAVLPAAEKLRTQKAHESEIGLIYGAIKSFYSQYGYGYATGGYVSGPGTGTSDSIPARLSNGEFVMNANAVKTYGADFMNALNQMQVQRVGSYGSMGGAAQSGPTMVYLSSEDRALLRAAIDRPVNLYTETTKIAQSANEGNVVLARRGVK